MLTHNLIGFFAGSLFVITVALTSNAQNVSVQPLITNLSNPTSIANAGDGTGRLFITEQDGRILIFDGTQILPTPFLDINTIVDDAGSEEGLLGLAFHPEFASNPDKKFFYVNYTTSSSQTVVERYTVSADGNSVVANSGEIVISFNQPAGNHNGGYLAFGSDDMLYISSGDGGGSPGNRAQETTNLLGKILRIGVDNDSCPNEIGENYCIPGSNPFGNEIWVLGLRNPWRFSFDDTGNMFIGDVGQGTIEEIDYQPVTSAGGENYGWQCFEGNNVFDNTCSAITHTPPITFYTQSSGNCSVTGGFRYQASDIPLLVNDYLYGDFCTGRIWRATENSPGNWSSILLIDTSINIASFGEDENGEIYILDNPFSGNGGLYKLVNNDPPPPGNTGPFIEEGGQVVMEAENYDDIVSRGSKNWELRTIQGGFSGTGYMQSLPNTQVSNNTGYATNSPELKYLVNFTNPGTYFVWLRGCGTSGSNDSAHVGVNGQENTTANRMKLVKNCSSFVWTRARMSNAPDATVTVGSGVNEINLWMREDGSRIDRILLTTSSSTPAGTGPAENPREPGQPPEVFTLNIITNGGTGTGDITSSPGGINCGPDCSGDYDENEVVTLTAVADTGSDFISWSGDCTGSSTITNVIMTSNKTCTAQFDLEPPVGTGPFIEEGGQVVMEAENYDDIVSRGSKNWELRTIQGGFSGTGYMQSLPNTQVSNNTGYATNSPELKYLVNFTNPGTYFVWLRGCGTSGSNDSAHVGVNGQENTTANRMKLVKNCSSFVWTRARMSNAPDATVTVGSGVNEINLWMREDGSRIDRILLTTSSNTPAGAGPAESPREVADN